MALFVLRVWLPDRPGALGSVASRIGSVGADVVGVEIIDRGAGRAVDELTVDLPAGEGGPPEDRLIELLVVELRELDGVDVEDIRPLGRPQDDPAVAALAVAARVATAPGDAEAAEAIVEGALRLVHADWAVLVDLGRGERVAAAGADPPNGAWVCGFVHGTGAATEVDDIAVAEVTGRGWVLVTCRQRLPLRGRERALLVGLAALG